MCCCASFTNHILPHLRGGRAFPAAHGKRSATDGDTEHGPPPVAVSSTGLHMIAVAKLAIINQSAEESGIIILPSGDLAEGLRETFSAAPPPRHMLPAQPPASSPEPAKKPMASDSGPTPSAIITLIHNAKGTPRSFYPRSGSACRCAPPPLNAHLPEATSAVSTTSAWGPSGTVSGTGSAFFPRLPKICSRSSAKTTSRSSSSSASCLKPS